MLFIKLRVFFFRQQEVDEIDQNAVPSTSHDSNPLLLEDLAVSSSEDFSSDDSVAEPTYQPDPNTLSSTSSEQQQNQQSKKRRLMSVKEKYVDNKNKHKMLPRVCSATCKKSCSEFTDEDRIDIWNEYWEKDYTVRRQWLAKCVEFTPVSRRRVSATNKYKRNLSRVYRLKKISTSELYVIVCKSFFLNTLGYSSDSVINELSCAVKKAPLNAYVKENRGKKSKKVCNREIISSHINSFNPCISHYRRKNAPYTKYLPSSLTVDVMFKDFNLKHPGVCKVETYRKMLKSMRISLHMPKMDSCSDCIEFKNLNEASNINRDVQDAWESHKKKADTANKYYKIDANVTENPGTKYFSFDLQKVLLLPIMPGNKDVFFTSRLVIFNEVFASLQKKSNNNYSVIWHEAFGGRDASNIIDAIYALIIEERDTNNFVFWADNCSAQNKNWFLFSALITLVNNDNDTLHVNKITLKYLTKGHTHMTADGVHGNIEMQIKKTGNVYDFEDLLNVIKKSRNNLKTVVVMKSFNWPKKKRQLRKNDEKDPMKNFVLNNIVEAEFMRGSTILKYKTDFDNDYKELNFLQKRFNCKKFPQEKNNRGITNNKKNDIINKLLPLMPQNRHKFWKDLPVTDTVSDLVQDYGLQQLDNDVEQPSGSG